MPPALEAQSPNHRTAREFPSINPFRKRKKVLSKEEKTAHNAARGQGKEVNIEERREGRKGRKVRHHSPSFLSDHQGEVPAVSTARENDPF